MTKLSRRQKATIANFRQISRVHFSLCHRNIGRRTHLQHFRRTIIQSLLIAGSVGIGGNVYAESSFSEGGTCVLNELHGKPHQLLKNGKQGRPSSVCPESMEGLIEMASGFDQGRRWPTLRLGTV